MPRRHFPRLWCSDAPVARHEESCRSRAPSWSYTDAALRGSSYLKLPKVLQFFSGKIGFHHVHHLSARIPSYNLPRAHNEKPIFHSVTTVSMTDGLRAVRLKLYDQGRGRMVSFARQGPLTSERPGS